MDALWLVCLVERSIDLLRLLWPRLIQNKMNKILILVIRGMVCMMWTAIGHIHLEISSENLSAHFMNIGSETIQLKLISLFWLCIILNKILFCFAFFFISFCQALIKFYACLLQWMMVTCYTFVDSANDDDFCLNGFSLFWK